jgi:hypothetical protein
MILYARAQRRLEPADLPERPPISDPGASASGVQVEGVESPGARQPRLGLVGLTLVVPIAAVLAFGWGGADGSVVVLGPLVTYALPLIVMIAFWWEDWPGTRLRGSLSGWADTAIIIVGAVLLTAAGQAIAGGFHLAGIFDAHPGRGQVPTFTATLPLGGAAFVAMLEITLVGEGWPLRRLPGLSAGVVATMAAWIVGLIVYFTLAQVSSRPLSGVTARTGPVPSADLGAALVLVGALQVLFYVVWRGWPFSALSPVGLRLGLAHAVVIGAGIAAFLICKSFGIDRQWLAAACGCFVAAGLLVGMLFDDSLTARFGGGGERAALLAAVLALAACFELGLHAVATSFSFTRATPDEWVEHATLNAIAVSTILHVAIGRRWPFMGFSQTRRGVPPSSD